MAANVAGQRMDLQRQIAAIHRVEKIEPNRELRAKTAIYRFSQQFLRPVENKIDGRNLDAPFAEPEQQAVLLRHAVEAPRIIRLVSRKVHLLHHPVAAPWPRIEKWHDPERPPCRDVEAAAEIVTRNHLRFAWNIGVEQVIDPREQLLFQLICDAPVDEESALVFLTGRLGAIVRSKISDFVAAVALLYLPAREIRINENVRMRRDQRRARTDNERHAWHPLGGPRPQFAEPRGVEQILKLKIAHQAENRVVGKERINQPVDLSGSPQRLPGANHGARTQPVRQRRLDFPHIHAGITLDAKDGRVPQPICNIAPPLKT